MSNDFLTICRERGFIHQCTDEEGLRALLKTPGVPAYIGFDCTAPSLHVGSLMQIMILRWFQKCGHKPIVLMGGGTTKVGDPSGKDASRQLLDYETIARNMASIKGVFSQFLTFGTNASDAIMLDNDEWLSQLTVPFIFGTLGPLISVNKMLSKDSIRQRLERQQHLSYLEFNYMILQAYDFVKLYEDYGCRLQIGGSDQWGNITAGTELHHKMQEVGKLTGKETIFGLTTPLLTTSSGAKMGKTADGAMWLNYDPANPDFSRTPYDYWQFWRNTEDADVETFLKLFTELPLDHITGLMAGNINDAKKVLATEATALLHGRAEAEQAADTAARVFEGGGLEGLPEIEIAKAELQAGIPAFKLLHTAGLADSGGKARQLIKGNGAKLNDAAFTAEDQPVTLADLTADGVIKLSAGKKRHVLVRAV